jgi:hypothetical protein
VFVGFGERHVDDQASHWRIRLFDTGYAVGLFVVAAIVGADLALTLKLPLEGIVVAALASAAVLGPLALLLGRWIMGFDLRVGVDGIQVRQALRRQRLPYGQISGARVIESIVPHYRGVALPADIEVRVFVQIDQVDRGPIRLRVGSREQTGDLAERIVRRVAEARSSHGSRTDAAVVAQLERGAQDADAWTRSLKAMGGAGQYRVAGVSLESLWTAVEDGSLPAAQRVAAAVALDPRQYGDRRARLLELANKTTDLRAGLLILVNADGRDDDAVAGEALRRAH